MCVESIFLGQGDSRGTSFVVTRQKSEEWRETKDRMTHANYRMSVVTKDAFSCFLYCAESV